MEAGFGSQGRGEVWYSCEGGVVSEEHGHSSVRPAPSWGDRTVRSEHSESAQGREDGDRGGRSQDQKA